MSRVSEHARGLERGRDCYARRAWAEAYEALHAADQSSQLGVEDLERIAWSAALTGRDDALLSLLERLHQAHLEAGNTTRAAHAAFWLGFRLLSMGEMGRASGWLLRAQRLVEQETSDCVVRGYLILPVVYRKLGSADYDAAYASAREAAEIGERCGDRDLTSFARHLQGRVLLEKGQLDDGLALLDEAMVAVTTGELSAIICGFLYCGMIASCQKVYALGRAREWTAALARWCESQPQLVTFTGSCMIHRSQIMQLGGDWSEAIAEAHRAAERYSGSSDQEVVAEAMYQQAEIHRLRGEFEAAEETYRRASQLGRDAQPGLALLRLAQKRHEPSAGAIRRVVEAATQRMERAKLLPAYVEIMLAVGDVDSARLAAAELEEIAAGFAMEGLTAIARHARGAVQLAEGDARAALESFRRAFVAWQQLGAPYFAARLRVQVGCACRALGDEDGALLELDAAREAFERLGARPDVVRVDSLKKNAEVARRHGLTSREVQVLRLVASGKTNKAIAEELGLSEKTVDRHVSNIFTKLDVSSRAAATAHAYEHELI
jgi:DNA-binding CsgD family transcriptional regulator